jgi:hypothetical protein
MNIESENVRRFLDFYTHELYANEFMQKRLSISDTKSSSSEHIVGGVKFSLIYYGFRNWTMQSNDWMVLRVTKLFSAPNRFEITGDKDIFDRDLIMLMMFHES